MNTNTPIFPLLKKDIAFLILLIISGSLLHFLYDWSNQSIIISPFAPVNESTWEHLKLLFFPATIITVLEFFLFKHNYPFITNKIYALLLGLISIPILFYSYTFIVGTHFLFADILIFIISVLIFWFVSKFLNYKGYNKSIAQFIFAITIFIILLIMFIVFTFYPPHCFLFQDPITMSYGLMNK